MLPEHKKLVPDAWVKLILFGIGSFYRLHSTFLCCDAGVGTKIDPTLCRADRMVGQVLGAVGALPEIFTELEISYFLLRRLLGVRTEGDKKAAKVKQLLAVIRVDADLECDFTLPTFISLSQSSHLPNTIVVCVKEKPVTVRRA